MDCSEFTLVQPKNRRGDTRAQPWMSHWPPNKDKLVKFELHQPGAEENSKSQLISSALGSGVGKNRIKLYKLDDDDDEQPEAKKEETVEQQV